MDYKDLMLFQSSKWKIFLHKNQQYLGRVYFLYDGEESDIFRINAKDLIELKGLVLKVQKALNSCFMPDKYNYSSLNNDLEHMHMHMVPRYKKVREFAGHIFKDVRWGLNYAPYDHGYILKPEILKEIVYKLKHLLKNEIATQ